MYYHLPKDMLPAFFTLLFQVGPPASFALTGEKKTQQKNHSFQMHPFTLMSTQGKQKKTPNILREIKRSAEESKTDQNLAPCLSKPSNIQQAN